MKLKQIVMFSGKIYCVSGLSIGGYSSTLDIGGVDREVIKNPITKEPYIPGSSLKGKMRSELEKKYGTRCWIKKTENQNKEVLNTDTEKDKVLVEGDKEPCGCGNKSCPICVIFGSHKNPGAASAPTRIIVRDAILSKEKMGKNMVILERKIENIISRTSDTADSPRTIERVPAGTYFDFEIVLRIFEGDNKQNLIDKVIEGLDLVQKSYLGGGGSRGSGYVRFAYKVQDGKITYEVNKFN